MLPAPQSTPPAGTRAGTPPIPPDALRRRKALQPDDLKHLNKKLTDARRHLHWDLDDEEGNKENQPPTETPEDHNENEEDPYHLPSLLKKWDKDITRFQERVYQDLEDLRKRLGILH